jgi:ribosomal protein S18 acetylase RimI-like enzyme
MLTLDLDHLHARPAQPADDAFLKAVFATTRDDLRAVDAGPALFAMLIDMQWHAQTAGYRQAFPDADSLVIERAGVPLGRLLVDCGMPQWRIVDVALLPQARGQGHGAALLRALQIRARDSGATLALTVRRDNPAARRLYGALGFAADGGDVLTEQMVWPAARQRR